MNTISKWADAVSKFTGKPIAFILSIFLIVVWGLTGPIFHFSDGWQLMINSTTTVITFWMVFAIQHSQNKDTTALHLKLDELIAANVKTSNRLVDSENLTQTELDELKEYYKNLSKEDKDFYKERSLDEETKEI